MLRIVHINGSICYCQNNAISVLTTVVILPEGNLRIPLFISWALVEIVVDVMEYIFKFEDGRNQPNNYSIQPFIYGC
ncbi:hypothetical protein QFZ48_001459 [Chitinophaga sp. W2I13]